MARKVAPLVPLSFAFMFCVTVWSAQNPATSGGSVPTAANDPRLATLEPKVRQMVLEEADAAKVGCEGSAIAMNVYECDCYAREVFEERLRIGTAVRTLKNATGTREITAFATAMDPGVPTGIGACVSTPKTEKYGKELASGLQLNPSSAVSECAGRELAVRFKKLPRPKPELIQPLLIEAIQLCRRSLPPSAATTRPSTAAAPPQTAINAASNSTPTTTAQPSAVSSPTTANSSSNNQRRQVFTGSWEFVTRSGESTDAYTTGHLSDVGTLLVITQEGNLLTLGRTPQDAATTYRIDGIEHPFSYRRSNNPNDPITTGTTTATATGDRIVVEIRLQYPDGFRTVSAKRVFSLAADGGLLVETTGSVRLKNGVSSDLNSSTLYKRSPVSQTSASPPAPATPKPLGTPAPAERASPPPSADTQGERQAKIQSDVAERTKAVIEELRQKPQAGQPAAVTALGTPWQPCGGALRSTQSQTSVAVEFVNSSSEPRKLYWMDFGGMRKLYGTLRPGQRAPMQTYTKHSWIVADSSDRCLGTIVIAGAARLEIR